MRREDLEGEEQGWQVIDSTPVQMCDGSVVSSQVSILPRVFFLQGSVELAPVPFLP